MNNLPCFYRFFGIIFIFCNNFNLVYGQEEITDTEIEDYEFVDSAATVPMIAYWATGDSYEFEVTKIEKRESTFENDYNDSITYIATFEVIDSAETYYLIKWSYFQDLNRMFNVPEHHREKLDKFEKVEVIYYTDYVGEIIAISNWKELSKQRKKLYSNVSSMVGSDFDHNGSSLKELRKAEKAMYSTQEGILDFVFPELLYFHYYMGYEYYRDSTVEYDEEFYNYVLEETMKGQVVSGVDSINEEESFVRFKYDMELDEDHTKDMITNFMRKSAKNDPMTQIYLKSMKLDISSDHTFEYNIYPLYPLHIETTENNYFRIPGTKMKETTKIKIKHIAKD